jgi:hypothetical protein
MIWQTNKSFFRIIQNNHAIRLMILGSANDAGHLNLSNNWGKNKH